MACAKAQPGPNKTFPDQLAAPNWASKTYSCPALLSTWAVLWEALKEASPSCHPIYSEAAFLHFPPSLKFSQWLQGWGWADGQLRNLPGPQNRAQGFRKPQGYSGLSLSSHSATCFVTTSDKSPETVFLLQCLLRIIWDYVQYLFASCHILDFNNSLSCGVSPSTHKLYRNVHF